MSIPSLDQARLVQFIKKWRAKLLPVFGVTILGIFIYWIFIYRNNIISTFRALNLVQLVLLLLFFIIMGLFTVYIFVTLVRDMGYSFDFVDGYHSLYYSQLASMIPGGIWGYAGLAGVLLSKGVSKADSILIIFLNTVIMLTSCAIIGITGLASIFGWGYAIISVLPFIILLLGRNWLDDACQKYFPDSSHFPSNLSLLKILVYGVIVWLIASLCYSQVLYSSIGYGVIPFWTVSGAYAAGYLGGYITLIAPSGIGVSEGLVTLILGPYAPTEKIMAAAISFRIIQTFIIWCNILIAIILPSKNNHRASTTE